jgi:ABC-type phosphate/phosphonate transport system substrate-binding protein
MIVANARMYTLGEVTGDAWRRLFDWIGVRAGAPLKIVEHAAPLPLSALWRRSDLGCVMMCGYPWATWRDADGPRPVALVAPIPSPREFEAQSRYRTDIVVRADSRFDTIAELADARFAYTVDDSQSGYQAPRALFAPLAKVAGGRALGDTIGPLFTPRRIVEAVVSGTADAGPLDAWWHALLRQREPRLAAQLRVVAVTPWTAPPLFVASTEVRQNLREQIVDALLTVEKADDLEEVRSTLLLRGFARIDPDRYAALAVSARAIDESGYPRLQ